MEGAKLQRKRLYELQDYIDAQYGGPGKGFLRIVTDPFQAGRSWPTASWRSSWAWRPRRCSAAAASDQAPECNQAKIDRGLAEFRKLGVRSFFPVHKFDNPLGGTKMDGGTTGLVVNPGNKIAFGRFWDARTCNGARDRQHAGHQRRRAGRRPVRLRGRHAAGRRPQRPDAGLSARARTATRAG